jgi:hypothetical protein
MAALRERSREINILPFGASKNTESADGGILLTREQQN